jgi:hypothetical protein
MSAAPDDAPPVELIGAALESVAAFFPDDRRDRSQLRQSVIDQHPALQERERHKLSTLATAIGDALRTRGVPEPAATLAAESAITVFSVSFAQWIRQGEERSIADIERAVLAELRGLVSPR